MIRLSIRALDSNKRKKFKNKIKWDSKKELKINNLDEDGWYAKYNNTLLI